MCPSEVPMVGSGDAIQLHWMQLCSYHIRYSAMCIAELRSLPGSGAGMLSSLRWPRSQAPGNMVSLMGTRWGGILVLTGGWLMLGLLRRVTWAAFSVAVLGWALKAIHSCERGTKLHVQTIYVLKHLSYWNQVTFFQSWMGHSSCVIIMGY